MSNLRIPFSVQVDKIIDHNAQIRELILKTQSPFKFKAGQFVMLHVPQGDSKPALRAYSIASGAQFETQFHLIFKFVENGIASKYVWNLSEKEELKFTGPFGKVFFIEPPCDRILFLNTGSGVSQHFSFLESFGKKYPHVEYHMYFGVRNESDIYYEEKLKQLQINIPKFRYDFVLSRGSESWSGKKGYVQDELKKINLFEKSTTLYLCGNNNMIKDTKTFLESVQFPKQNIWSEAFD